MTIHPSVECPCAHCAASRKRVAAIARKLIFRKGADAMTVLDQVRALIAKAKTEPRCAHENRRMDCADCAHFDWAGRTKARAAWWLAGVEEFEALVEALEKHTGFMDGEHAAWCAIPDPPAVELERCDCGVAALARIAEALSDSRNQEEA